MAVEGQNQQLSSLPDRYTYMRTGRVLSVNPFFALVDIGSTSVPAAYVRQSEPEVGDIVSILRQSASWMVVGTTSSSGANLVRNPSFEEVDTNGKPSLWTLYNATNVTSWESVPADDALDQDGGHRVLEVWNPGVANATSFVYSAPISVVGGEVWEISAYVNGYYPADNPNTSDVYIAALWFNNATDLYPTTAAADSVVPGITNIAENPLMTSLSGNVTVPVAAEFMRVGLHSILSPGAGAHWDFVTARKVG